MRHFARRALFREVLGDVAELIEASQRVYVSPDGPLNRLPFAEIGSEASCTGEPGGDARAREPACWITVPSATVLAGLHQRRTTASPSESARILAVASRANQDSRDLSGTVREARNLRERYANVDLRILAHEGTSCRAEDLATADIIHVATHVRTDDQAPWQSEIQLYAPGDSANLRAAQIAHLALSGRLVVLSSCESASGRIVAGEGVLGLTSAFLSAGVPAVLATLWPVDDRATVDLMEAFYQALARGRTAATALAEAQATMRGNPDTSHPCYWAGFVLVGDGQQRFLLEERRVWPAALLIPALLGLAAAFIVFSRRGRTRKIMPRGQ
jgi:CHAT domain-containing protein